MFVATIDDIARGNLKEKAKSLRLQIYLNNLRKILSNGTFLIR